MKSVIARARAWDEKKTGFSMQNNLAITYSMLGRDEEALGLQRDVYSGRLKLNGEQGVETIGAAHNYANSLLCRNQAVRWW